MHCMCVNDLKLAYDVIGQGPAVSMLPGLAGRAADCGTIREEHSRALVDVRG
jgi:hypothetical protein